MTQPITRVGVAAIFIAGVGLVTACRGRIESGAPAPECPDDCAPIDAGPIDGEPPIDAGPPLAANLLVAANFPSSVFHAVSADREALGYGSADGVFVADVLGAGGFTAVEEIAAGKRPMRIDTNGEVPTVAGGGAFVLALPSGNLRARASKINIPGEVTCSTGDLAADDGTGLASKVWAVPTGTGAGIYRSVGTNGPVVRLGLPFGGAPAATPTAVFAQNADTLLIGDVDGNLLWCSQTSCAPLTPFSAKRLDAFTANPRDPHSPYALFADAIVATRTRAALATETAGFDGPGGYYARSIASGLHCIYFSSKRGLEWARDVDGKMDGGILVPRQEAEIVGVAAGPAPRTEASAVPRASVYFTVFDERAKRGGVYYVDEPSQCVNKEFFVGGYLTGNGPGGARLRLNGVGPLVLKTNGPFLFPQGLPDGTDYTIVDENPGSCRVVSGGTGRIKGAHVHTVQVECRYAG